MEILDIKHGIEIIAALLCFIVLLPSSLKVRNLTKVYLLGSICCFFTSKIYVLIGPSYLVRDVETWGNFVSISLVLSALFVIIRDSKPMFARFPIYLTLLPLSGIIFFAVIPTSYAIKDILEIIMQAGAIVVALLIFGVNRPRRAHLPTQRFKVEMAVSLLRSQYGGYHVKNYHLVCYCADHTRLIKLDSHWAC